MAIHEEFLFTEKYRPHTVADTILPKNIKSVFQSFVDQKEVQNLLLTGKPGVGKTTIAMAMLDELGCDYIMINGSLEGRVIDTLRTSIIGFASTVSLQGGRKYVIIDEADYMNAQSVQPALRNFIEEYANNCGFILTCNYKDKLIPALRDSRFAVVDFKFDKKDLETMCVEFFKRAQTILNKEDVLFDKAVVAEVIKRFCPDWRRVLNELQKYSASGQIDAGSLYDAKEVVLKDVIEMMKNKDFKSLRKWVSDNSDVDPAYLFSAFYDNACTYLKKNSVPILVLLLAKYQYQVPFVANQEINTMAFFVEVMTECEFA